MPKDDIAHVPEKNGSEKAILLWFLGWFVLINLAVYAMFDTQFFSHASRQRLLMNPSENQIDRVISAINKEKDIRHVIFLGNSIVWGVGVDDEAQTMVGRVKAHYANRSDVRVLSLAVPGESLLDSFAVLRKTQNPDNLFVLVVNTTLVEDHERDPSFRSLVHFPVLVEEEFSAERKDVAQCCLIAIPPPRFAALRRFAETVLPLYGDRDALAHRIIGISFADAERAVLGRFFSGGVATVFTRKPMAWEHGVTDHRALPEAEGSWPLKLLSKLFSENGRADNVITVLMDDDRYDRGKAADRNAALLRRALSGGTLVDLYGKLHGKFYDTLHVTPAGHEAVANKLIPILDRKLHAP